MYEVDATMADDEFIEMWNAAGQFLQSCAKEAKLRWLRADPLPPYLEHMSFTIGNQIFHIRVEDVEQDVQGPGSLDGFRRLTDNTGGVPCVLWMERVDEKWQPVDAGWGLRNAFDNEVVNPAELVTDKDIEITDWEVHDLGVGIAKQYLEERGIKVTERIWWDPEITPALWFEGEDSLEWVIVDATRYPNDPPPVDQDRLQQHIESFGKMGRPHGHHIGVAIASMEEQFDPENFPVSPIYRGHGVYPKVVMSESLTERFAH